MFLPSNITLKLGDSGDFVAELQRRLAARDFLGRDMITSFYDGATVHGVRQFQAAHGIRADGVAGPETLRRLNGFGDNTATGSSSGGAQGDSEQASGITPVNQRLLQLQAEQDMLLDQQRFQQELEQQTALHEQQHQQQVVDPTQKQLEWEKAQHLTETKKELPGVEQKRDQHIAPADLANMLAANQQSFIDRPISQTFAGTALDQKPEQEIGAPNRGPNLGHTPERSAETPGQARAQTELAPTRDPMRELPREAPTQGLTPNQSPAQGTAPNQPAHGAGAERAPLRIHSPSQGANIDFERIRGQMEARLPAHVIQEVRQVGVVMLHQGVQGGQSTPAPGAPVRTPGMEEKQASVGGGRGM